MFYIIVFSHLSKDYSRCITLPRKLEQNQFEVVANQLMRDEIEANGLSKEKAFTDAALLEVDEQERVMNPVWAKDVYYPYCQEEQK